MFGSINLVTGNIEYDFAHDSRQDNKKCGKNGLLFQSLDIKTCK